MFVVRILAIQQKESPHSLQRLSIPQQGALAAIGFGFGTGELREMEARDGATGEKDGRRYKRTKTSRDIVLFRLVMSKTQSPSSLAQAHALCSAPPPHSPASTLSRAFSLSLSLSKNFKKTKQKRRQRRCQRLRHLRRSQDPQALAGGRFGDHLRVHWRARARPHDDGRYCGQDRQPQGL